MQLANLVYPLRIIDNIERYQAKIVKSDNKSMMELLEILDYRLLPVGLLAFRDAHT